MDRGTDVHITKVFVTRTILSLQCRVLLHKVTNSTPHQKPHNNFKSIIS